MSTGTEDKEHELEQWLDAALVRRAKVEPRPGLENRVLATLQAEQHRLALRRRWWTMGTAAAAATIAVAMWIGLHGKQPTASRGPGHSVANEHTSSESRPAVSRRPAQITKAQEVVRNPPRHTKIVPAARPIEPKLDQFPSSREMSVAEEQLVQYLQAAPDAALLKPHRASEIAELHIDDLKTKPLEIKGMNSKPLN